MKLYVMRHGPAEDHAASGLDDDRALTPSGRACVAAVARSLAEQDEAPYTIVSSPLVRALETAEIVSEITSFSRRARQKSPPVESSILEVRPELALGGDAIAVVVEHLRARNKRVMLVGHEPELSELIATLGIGAAALPQPFSLARAMVVGTKLTLDARVPELGFRSKLRFVLDPATLAAIG